VIANDDAAFTLAMVAIVIVSAIVVVAMIVPAVGHAVTAIPALAARTGAVLLDEAPRQRDQ
jgi:hypothetical protein